MSAPIIHWIRPGVGYAPEAAASMLRVEAELGRPHQSNSSYRDYNKQLGMYRAWNAYAAGRGPKPPHSRAIHPDFSKHCQGLADDSNEWIDLDYRAILANHGWIRTAASDLTERHHFEYQSWRDNHRHDGVPSTSTQTPPTIPEENDMDKLLLLISIPQEKNPKAYDWYLQNLADGTIFNLRNNIQIDYFKALGLRKFENQHRDVIKGFRSI